MAAVGLCASMNNNFIVQSEAVNNMGKRMKIEFHLPWAIVVSGVGGVFAAVAGVVMAIFLACKDRREAPGMWTQMAAGKPF